jgi:hypothetical protein
MGRRDVTVPNPKLIAELLRDQFIEACKATFYFQTQRRIDPSLFRDPLSPSIAEPRFKDGKSEAVGGMQDQREQETGRRCS